jgi:four helix bundle protein
MTESPIKNKSYKLAIRIVVLYKTLTEEHKEYVLSKEVLKSGTSIGAHVREAAQAESRADFIHEMAIALKEASKTQYWLELLRDTKFLKQESFDSIYGDCEEVLKLLTAIVKSSKQRT